MSCSTIKNLIGFSFWIPCPPQQWLNNWFTYIGASKLMDEPFRGSWIPKLRRRHVSVPSTKSGWYTQWQPYSPRFPCTGCLLIIVGALLPSRGSVLCRAGRISSFVMRQAVNWAWRGACQRLYEVCVPFIPSASLFTVKLALNPSKWCYLPAHNWFSIFTLQETEISAHVITLKAMLTATLASYTPERQVSLPRVTNSSVNSYKSKGAREKLLGKSLKSGKSDSALGASSLASQHLPAASTNLQLFQAGSFPPWLSRWQTLSFSNRWLLPSSPGHAAALILQAGQNISAHLHIAS